MLIRVYKDKDAILVRYDEELRVAPMGVSWLGSDFISMVTDLRDLYSYDPITEEHLADLEVILIEDSEDISDE